MKDKALNEHYQQILGDTSPWAVSEVRLDVERLVNEVKLTVKPDAIWALPAVPRRMHIKEWRTRRWRHLDTCQFKTILEAAVPVVECSEHGAQTVQVPWAEGSSRFTLFFESFAIQVLEACPTARAAELLKISWDEADGIKQRAVRRGLARRQISRSGVRLRGREGRWTWPGLRDRRDRAGRRRTACALRRGRSG